METKINSSKSKGNIFGPETFSATYVIVKDSNNDDIQVALDDLLEEKPNDGNIYVKVYYYGQSWWISQDFHFPM
ncbi:hypothetical protein HOO68_05400 [Candidatus Gracilibacteria bacterium]|nr:hypothetical protein [Candidatus Gracilibacteria bacterium]